MGWRADSGNMVVHGRFILLKKCREFFEKALYLKGGEITKSINTALSIVRQISERLHAISLQTN
jgi:hypothetical protein